MTARSPQSPLHFVRGFSLAVLLLVALPAEASVASRCISLMTVIKEALFGTQLDDATLASMKRVRKKGPITDNNFEERYRELYRAARERLYSDTDPYATPNDNKMLGVLRNTFASPEPPGDFQTVFGIFNRELSQVAVYPSISLYVVPGVERLAPEFLDMLTIRNQHRDPENMAGTEKALIRAQYGRRWIAAASAFLAVIVPATVNLKLKTDELRQKSAEETRIVQETNELFRKIQDAAEHPEKYSPEDIEKMREEFQRLLPKLPKQAP